MPSKDLLDDGSIEEAALIGGAIGAAQVLLSSAIATLSIPLCGAAGRDAVSACAAVVAIAGYGIEFDGIIGSLAPISGNPLVDQLVSVTLLGAAVGAGAYGLFSSQDNQAKTDKDASESTKRFSPA